MDFKGYQYAYLHLTHLQQQNLLASSDHKYSKYFLMSV